MTWRKEAKVQKPSRKIPILAVVSVLVVVGGIAVYTMNGAPTGPSSSIMVCSVESYGVFSALTYKAGTQSSINYTETTGTVFTSVTNVNEPIGRVTTSATDFGTQSGFVDFAKYQACTFITTSNSTSSSSAP